MSNVPDIPGISPIRYFLRELRRSGWMSMPLRLPTIQFCCFPMHGARTGILLTAKYGTSSMRDWKIALFELLQSATDVQGRDENRSN
jgi:hypothetical protein